MSKYSDILSEDSDIESYISDTEREIEVVRDEYNKQIDEIPVEYPEMYGMTKDKAIETIKKLERGRDEKIQELQNNLKCFVEAYKTRTVINNDSGNKHVERNSYGIRTTYNNSMAVNNLKVPKVKHHSANQQPSIQRPKGQSLHPAKNKRNAAYRKRAKANQTSIKSILTNAAVFGSLFGAANGLYQEFANRDESDKIIEVIKRMSEGYGIIYLMIIDF